MNAVTAIVLATATVFAVGNWIGRLLPSGDRRAKPLEYVCKPATLALLVLAATTLEPDSGPMRWWFVAALVLSLAGDVFLMLPSDRFVEGLGSFLLGHLAYVAGFVAVGVTLPRIAIGLVVAAIVIVPVGSRIVPAATLADRRLTGPVTAYISVISAMIVAAIGSGRVVAIGGAALFAFSDSLIGWTRFVGPLRHAPVTIMVTYHLGQALLLLSLV